MRFTSLVPRLRRAADAVGGLLFLALFGVFLLQIVWRFVLHRPLPWTDEAAVVLYVWVILWAASVMVPAREHVAFDLIWNAVGPRTRILMQLLGQALVGGLTLAALSGNIDYVLFMRREHTAVLGLPFMLVYAPFVLLLLSLVLRSAWQLWRTLRGEPVA